MNTSKLSIFLLPIRRNDMISTNDGLWDQTWCAERNTNCYDSQKKMGDENFSDVVGRMANKNGCPRERVSKNKQYGLKNSRMEPKQTRIYALPNNPERCIVNLYKKYISHRPETNGGKSCKSFYLAAKSNYTDGPANLVQMFTSWYPFHRKCY